MNSETHSPLISIITITFNSEEFLEQTIQSVAHQTYSNIEYIIIDGNSTDGTKNIISRYSNSTATFISEADNGIADAMNKGIKIAKGDYLLFLHSDDYLTSKNSIKNAVTCLDDTHDFFAFDILHKSKTGYIRRQSTWGVLHNFKSKIFHQGVLCRSSLFQEIGVFDQKFAIAMDYDFFLRAYNKNKQAKLIHTQTLSTMRTTGLSSQTDPHSIKHRFGEEKKVHKKNTDSTLWKIIYHLYWSIYPTYREFSDL